MENPFEVLEARLIQKIDRLEYLLIQLIDQNQKLSEVEEPEYIIGNRAAAEFVGVGLGTMEKDAKYIPHTHRNKKNYFKRSDLIEYRDKGLNARAPLLTGLNMQPHKKRKND